MCCMTMARVAIMVAMSDVSDLEGEKIAATKLAVNTEINQC